MKGCGSQILVVKAGTPLKKGGLAHSNIFAPCGKCPDCKLKRVNDWVFRLLQEEKNSTSGAFITMTYDTKTVPITKNGFMSLDKTHTQDFWRTLRRLDKGKIKYYLAGEYGEKRWRPHYHAIVFNFNDPENIYKSWKLGSIHVDLEVNSSNIAYCAKYIDKDKRIPIHGRDDRIKEFSLMSKKLGLSYLTENIIQFHKEDYINRQIVQVGQRKQRMPRYFREKVFTEEEREEYIEHVKDIQDAEYFRQSEEYYKNNKTEKSYEQHERERQQQKIESFRKANNSRHKKDVG